MLILIVTNCQHPKRPYNCIIQVLYAICYLRYKCFFSSKCKGIRSIVHYTQAIIFSKCHRCNWTWSEIVSIHTGKLEVFFMKCDKFFSVRSILFVCKSKCMDKFMCYRVKKKKFSLMHKLATRCHTLSQTLFCSFSQLC